MDGESADAAVGDRIAETRRQKALRQEDFLELLEARGLSWTRTTLSRIESGQRALKAVELFVVADVLGISADELNPESGSLPYAIQRQRARYRAAAMKTAVSAKVAQATKDGLVAVLLANELCSGRTSFVVHGTPLTFMSALGSAVRPDDQQISSADTDDWSQVHKILGLDHDEYLKKHKRFVNVSVAKKLVTNKNNSRDDVREYFNGIYDQLLSARFPELKFVGKGDEPLTVDGLEVNDGR